MACVKIFLDIQVEQRRLFVMKVSENFNEVSQIIKLTEQYKVCMQNAWLKLKRLKWLSLC